MERAYHKGKTFSSSVNTYVTFDGYFYHGSVEVGEEYYETDPCRSYSSAANEMLGYLQGLNEKIEKEVGKIKKDIRQQA